MTTAQPASPLTKTDLTQATNGLTQHIKQQLNYQTDAITANVQKSVDDAYNSGRNKTYADLSQKLDGQQARLDRIVVDKTEADRMASADHSLIEQIKQHFAKLMLDLNQNTKTETELVNQLQQPIVINGDELLKAIEDESNSTVSQLLSRQVANYINGSVQSVQQQRQDIADDNQQIKKQVNHRFNHLYIWLSIMMITILATIIVPFWPVKLGVAMVGLLGGVAYGAIEKKLG